MNKPNEARKRAEQTCYAITDKRLLIIDDYKRKSVESYDLDKIEFLEHSENKDGTGDIYFTKTLMTSTSSNDRDDNSSSRSTTHEVKKGFKGIYDSANVKAEITKRMMSS
ncbi:PH domain-containing protein [Kiloniella sp. EL199]|uniref:PH domain-containing protein n=1 Tax=Kiloniella sp. EL199 TaxID=2107581 RepID=UPI0013C49301|nr:PH domain-containing protein [Kiloniella sp. EL199]